MKLIPIWILTFQLFFHRKTLTCLLFYPIKTTKLEIKKNLFEKFCQLFQSNYQKIRSFKRNCRQMTNFENWNLINGKFIIIHFIFWPNTSFKGWNSLTMKPNICTITLLFSLMEKKRIMGGILFYFIYGKLLRADKASMEQNMFWSILTFITISEWNKLKTYYICIMYFKKKIIINDIQCLSCSLNFFFF